MLLFLASIILVTAGGVTAFMLYTSGNITKFKALFQNHKSVADFPMVTKDGTYVNNKEELDTHLEILENKFNDKIIHLQESRTKINEAKDSIEQLLVTQQQVRRYYITLSEEIKQSEEDCKRLQKQIDDYKTKRNELAQEISKTEIEFNNFVDATQNGLDISDSNTDSEGYSTDNVSKENSSENVSEPDTKPKEDEKPEPVNKLTVDIPRSVGEKNIAALIPKTFTHGKKPSKQSIAENRRGSAVRVTVALSEKPTNLKRPSFIN